MGGLASYAGFAAGAHAFRTWALRFSKIRRRYGPRDWKGIEIMTHAELLRKRGPSAPACKAASNGLRIGEPNDSFEQEADRVAEEVMTGGRLQWSLSSTGIGAPLQRKCSCGGSAGAEEECEECKKERVGAQLLQRSTENHAEPADVPPIVYKVLRSPGRPLDARSRAYLEPRFGHDFSGVRIHADGEAAASARTVNALAYTVGKHVVFGAGAYAPGTAAGRKLLAHELTHTIQQSSYGFTTAHGAVTLQRSPDFEECSTCERYEPLSGSSTFGAGKSSMTRSFRAVGSSALAATPDDDKDMLHFDRPGGRRVDEVNILDWATDWILSHSRTTFVSLLQRHEDAALTSYWQGQLDHRRTEILHSHGFAGSDGARRRWAEYLRANTPKLVTDLNRRSVYLLVQEIGVVLTSGKVRVGQTLVKDKETIELIEKHRLQVPGQQNPGRMGAEVGKPGKFGQGLWTFEQLSEKLKLYDQDLVFAGRDGAFVEVSDHPGIYFYITGWLHEFDPIVLALKSKDQLFADLWDAVGKVTKGVAVALVSPAEMVIETAKEALDTLSLWAATKGWIENYTCFSDICKEAEACLKRGQDLKECQNDALKKVAKNASIIIPLYEQGIACWSGDLEACGGIGLLALGLVPKRGRRLKGEVGEAAVGAPKGAKPLTQPELEEAAIREAIGRRRPGDPEFAKSLEELRGQKKTARPPASGRPAPAPPAKAPGQKGPAAPGKKPAKPPKRLTPKETAQLESERARFARQVHLTPDKLRAEIDQLKTNAADPAKVRRLSGPVSEDPGHLYDAEITTSENGTHKHRRIHGTRIWCRFSPGPPGCGEPVGEGLDQRVDATLGKGTGVEAEVQGEVVDPTAETSTASAKFKEERLRRIGKVATKKQTKDRAGAERKSAIARTNRLIAKEKELRLRAAKDIAQVERSRASGPEKTAETNRLRQEIGKRNTRIDELEAQIKTLQADPRDALRAYSYSSEAEMKVTSRALGFDEYSKEFSDGPAKKIKKPSMDHLLPVDEIFELDGFWDLYEEDQKAILSDTENLFMMEQSLNSSKGKSIDLTNWKEGRRYYGEQALGRLAKRQGEIRAKLQARIDGLPKKPGAKSARAGAGSPSLGQLEKEPTR
jgi:hypothetical protein